MIPLPIKIEFDADSLGELVEQALERVIARRPEVRTVPGSQHGQLLYTEPQAAERLGITPIGLKEERLKGRIQHLKRGRQIKYLHEHLLDYVRDWGKTCTED